MTAGTAGGGKPFADIALVARLDPDTEKLMASTADGDPLPAAVIEMLAGESSWFGLVLSAKGVPMWKGRNIRRATTSQFQALMALYGGCAGCGEPDEDKLNAHHMDPFAWGGRTDLDNLIPLCWSCHGKIHDHDWQVVGLSDGKYTIRPPDRIHHGAARLPEAAPLFAPTEPICSRQPNPGRHAAPGDDDACNGVSEQCEQGRADRAPGRPSRTAQSPRGPARRSSCRRCCPWLRSAPAARCRVRIPVHVSQCPWGVSGAGRSGAMSCADPGVRCGMYMDFHYKLVALLWVHADDPDS